MNKAAVQMNGWISGIKNVPVLCPCDEELKNILSVEFSRKIDIFTEVKIDQLYTRVNRLTLCKEPPRGPLVN